MKEFLALFRKDAALEARSKEGVAVMLCLALLLTVVASCGVTLGFLSPDAVSKVAPSLLWMTFIFSATASIGRSLESELEFRAIDGVLLTGVSPALIYLSKTATNFLTVFFGHLAAVVLFTLLLDLNWMAKWPELCALSVAVILGYAALATLLAAIASTARMRGLLLPIVLVPTLFPLLFGALEQTFAITVDGRFDPASFWFGFLLFLDVLYLVLGINLYEHVIKD